MINREKEKYLNIYSGNASESYVKRHGEGYGRGNWGLGVSDYIITLSPSSLLDVGCGYGEFCNSMAPYVNTVYGCDIGSVATGNVINNPKITYLDAESHMIPIEDNSIECLTCFDVLEHVLPEYIDATFEEFKRISSKYLILSISYEEDSHDGVPYHMTVRPENWWLEKISNYGKVTRVGNIPAVNYPYIVCELG
jgi:ubiquinone/menaquinone biosynthesis C-methylase UbiE